MCDKQTQARMYRMERLMLLMAARMGFDPVTAQQSQARPGATPGFDPNNPATPYPGSTVPTGGDGGWPGFPQPGQPPGQQPGCPPCGGGLQSCPPDLVSADTAAAIKAGPRGQSVSPAIAGLAAGAASPDIIIPSNGLQRTIFLTDLVSTLANLDNLRIFVLVGGIVKIEVNGGKFARGNANVCSTSCGLGVCVGPVESVTIRVVNQSGAALTAAGTAMTLDYRSAYRGEAGFDCPPCLNADGSQS